MGSQPVRLDLETKWTGKVPILRQPAVWMWSDHEKGGRRETTLRLPRSSNLPPCSRTSAMATSPLDELSIAERVDASCDRFEAEFLAGRRPRLEDFLGDTTESLRTQLFRGLLELELELRRRGGEVPQRE